MHRDHDIFIQGIEKEKRLELTFFSRKLRRQVVSLCAPLHYSKDPLGTAAGSQDEKDCYYLWNFSAKKGSNFLALSPSQITSIELTEHDFRVQEFYSLSSQARKTPQSPDITE